MRRQDWMAAAIGAIAVTSLVGGVAWATSPGGSTVIRACSNTKLFGALRVIDPNKGQQCAAFEVPISWNQTGPPGIAGAQGAPGPKGDDGQDGVDGVGSPGHDAVSVFGTGGLTVTNATTMYTLVPGLTATVDVPPNSVLYVATDGGLQNTSPSVNGFAMVDLAFVVDGALPDSGGIRRVVATNTEGIVQTIANWSFATTLTLAPGSHTIAVMAVTVDPGAAPANVSSGTAAQLQGALHVITIAK